MLRSLADLFTETMVVARLGHLAEFFNIPTYSYVYYFAGTLVRRRNKSAGPRSTYEAYEERLLPALRQ